MSENQFLPEIKDDSDTLNPDFSNQPPTNQYTTASSKNLDSRTQKSKPFITTFFKIVGVIVVVLLLVVAGGAAFLITKPDDSISKEIKKYVVTADKNTSKNSDWKSAEQTSDTEKKSSSVATQPTMDKTNNTQKFSFNQNKDTKTTVEVVQSVIPSVLSISLSQNSFRSGQQDLVSGTGYIVSEDGLVVTNKHVIAKKCGSNSNSIKITASNYRQEAFELQLLSVDPVDDIAILKIKDGGQKFTKVNFSDSSSLFLGSDVIAIGNALGELQNSVTRGVVSGLNRNIGSGLDDECTGGKTGASDNLIQTDAAINPGNSGGPLFDAAGNVIGMNTLGTSTAQNIGLAIPANTIVSVLNSFQKNNQIIRPRLGVFTQSITPLEKKQNTWIPVDYGEIILSPNTNSTAVGANTAASKAGLKDGDIILSLDNTKLIASSQNPSPLRRAILTKQAGDEISLTILKIKQETTEGFIYESEPIQITTTLGKINFELNKTNLSTL